MPHSVTPFLIFTGRAEEALTFYTSVIARSEVLSIERYGPGEAGAQGTVRSAVFSLAGLRVRCFDSPPAHDFGFTPAVSLFVECETEAELDALCIAMSEGGSVLMEPANYGFSEKFAWLNDRFGVSWQLNYAGASQL